MPAKTTHKNFLKQLNSRNIKYGDVLSILPNDDNIYVNTNTKLIFQCNNNHIWEALPRNILRGVGCPHCSKKAKKTHKEFVEALSERNKNYPNKKVFLCDDQTYQSSFNKLKFRCVNNHIWENTPSNIIHGNQGCKKCSGKAKKTHKEFIDELSLKTDFILAARQSYTTAHTKLKFVCPANHEWETRPIDVLIGIGCPHCAKRGYSQKAIKWLNTIMTSDSIFIQHAENNGEYLIPNTKFYADGYCSETNTIYEFYGDVFHGNLTKFVPSNKCHPYNKQVTAQYLHDRTIAREDVIKSLGYNIVSIWEGDFDSK